MSENVIRMRDTWLLLIALFEDKQGVTAETYKWMKSIISKMPEDEFRCFYLVADMYVWVTPIEQNGRVYFTPPSGVPEHGDPCLN